MKSKIIIGTILFSSAIFTSAVSACTQQPGCYDNCTKLFHNFWQQLACLMGKTHNTKPSFKDDIIRHPLGEPPHPEQ
ncbi:hypothetical protein ACW6MR_004890 [Escherichia coli]|nr:hypothetical protein [Escherichia coli]HCQ0567624.1 hypothetical protein [Escherichia coli]